MTPYHRWGRIVVAALICSVIAVCAWALKWCWVEPGQPWQANDKPSYYQVKLLSLLQSQIIAHSSPYLPHIQYYSARVDRAALRGYMTEHGMQLPKPDQYRSTYHSCESTARSFPEPFHPDMLVRNRTVRMQLPGGAPLASWRWDSGRITRQQWVSVPSNLRTSSGHQCAHCGPVLKFKVLDGRVYASQHNEAVWQRQVTEEMLQVAVYLYNIPDVDLLIHVYDGATEGLPVLGMNINMSATDAGFTLPFQPHWVRHTMSLQQAVIWADCMRTRYPRNISIPRAVWRGSNTDPVYSDVTLENLPHLTRYKLHQLSSLFWDILDARLTAIIQSPERQKIATWLGLPSPDRASSPYVMDHEQQQRYAVQLDADGNSWSSRFYQLVQHTQAPILKQASPLQAYFEHLFAPGGPGAVEHFAPDACDAVERSKQLLDSLGCGITHSFAAHYGPAGEVAVPDNRTTCTGSPHMQRPSSVARRLTAQKQQTQAGSTKAAVPGTRQGGWEQAVQTTNDVAAVLLNRWSMIESVAFSLTKYASLCDWKPQLEPDEYGQITSFTASSTGWLPAELTAAIDKAAKAGRKNIMAESAQANSTT